MSMTWRETTLNNLKTIYSGEYSDFSLLEEFVRRNGFNRMSTSVPDYGVADIIRKGGDYGRYDKKQYDKPPYIDHKCFFKNTKTGITCLTYNPYYEVGDIKNDVEKWAATYGLKTLFSDNSWYYPGRTCFVVACVKEADIII